MECKYVFFLPLEEKLKLLGMSLPFNHCQNTNISFTPPMLGLLPQTLKKIVLSPPLILFNFVIILVLIYFSYSDNIPKPFVVPFHSINVTITGLAALHVLQFIYSTT